MFYFICGIVLALIVLINVISKFKQNKVYFIVSDVCGIGLITSGILGFIFKDLEFIFVMLLVGFSAIYIVYSLIAFKKKK